MSLYDVSRLTGSTPLRAVGGRDSAARTTAAPRETGIAPADQGVTVETGNRVSAGNVPVDGDRVATIREALRDGSYPIVPARITDALIAARLMLSTN
jgi:negative regulator of flagellin synthesis FlgM